jgi:hypothetical protein
VDFLFFANLAERSNGWLNTIVHMIRLNNNKNVADTTAFIIHWNKSFTMAEPSLPISLKPSLESLVPNTHTVPNHISVAATRLDAIHHTTPSADIVPLTIFISMMTEVILTSTLFVRLIYIFCRG